jgi:hypothetical protein
LYIAVTDNKIFIEKSLNSLNTKLDGKLTSDDFRIINNDCIVNISRADLDFIQDKRTISKMLMSSFFRKDNTVKMICIFIMILNLLILMRG